MSTTPCAARLGFHNTHAFRIPVAASISAPNQSFSAGPDAGHSVRRPRRGPSSHANGKVAVAVACSRSRLDGAFQAGGGQEVRWPDFRALFAQIEPDPLRALKQLQQRRGNNFLEQIRPSLEEWQLQQLASQEKHSHEHNEQRRQQFPWAFYVFWQGCGRPSIPTPTAAFPARTGFCSYRGQGGRLRRVAILAPVAGVQEAACERAGFPACLDCSRTYSDNAQASATAGVTPPQARLASAVCLRTVAV